LILALSECLLSTLHMQVNYECYDIVIWRIGE